jgi:hypothetical protein
MRPLHRNFLGCYTWARIFRFLVFHCNVSWVSHSNTIHMVEITTNPFGCHVDAVVALKCCAWNKNYATPARYHILDYNLNLHRLCLVGSIIGKYIDTWSDCNSTQMNTVGPFPQRFDAANNGYCLNVQSEASD